MTIQMKNSKLNDMKDKLFMFTVRLMFFLVCFMIALFAGKTSINGWNITIERPLTAILVFAALIMALIEEH